VLVVTKPVFGSEPETPTNLYNINWEKNVDLDPTKPFTSFPIPRLDVRGRGTEAASQPSCAV